MGIRGFPELTVGFIRSQHWETAEAEVRRLSRFAIEALAQKVRSLGIALFRRSPYVSCRFQKESSWRIEAAIGQGFRAPGPAANPAVLPRFLDNGDGEITLMATLMHRES